MSQNSLVARATKSSRIAKTASRQNVQASTRVSRHVRSQESCKSKVLFPSQNLEAGHPEQGTEDNWPQLRSRHLSPQICKLTSAEGAERHRHTHADLRSRRWSLAALRGPKSPLPSRWRWDGWRAGIKQKARARKWATDIQISCQGGPGRDLTEGAQKPTPQTPPVRTGRAHDAAESQNKSPVGDWLRFPRNESEGGASGSKHRPTPNPKPEHSRRPRGGGPPEPSRTGLP